MEDTCFAYVNQKEMTHMKCTKCHTEKDEKTEFYYVKGVRVKFCKKCTIARNAIYQKRHPNRLRELSEEKKEKHKAYMKIYYKKNRKKMKKDNDDFLKRNPDYHKHYRMKRKEFLMADKDFID